MPGPFGLREPDPLRCPRVAPTELDCVFVPGVAFDEEGYRLGRGGGFYDGFLGQAPAKLPASASCSPRRKSTRVPRETARSGAAQRHHRGRPDLIRVAGESHAVGAVTA